MSIIQFCMIMDLLRKTMKAMNKLIVNNTCIYDDHRVSYLVQGVLELFNIEYSLDELKGEIKLNENS